MSLENAIQALQEQFPDLDLTPRSLATYLDGRASGQLCVSVPPDRLLEFASFARADQRTRFEQLSDITCVDYLNYPDPPSDERFGVTYNFLSIALKHRLFVKVFVSDPAPSVPSLVSVYKGAEWLEREVFDMFGIDFPGHHDLRRILTPDGFKDNPLRKDYPLRGKGEREQFDIVTRETA